MKSRTWCICIAVAFALFWVCGKDNPTKGNDTSTFTLTVNATNGTVTKSPNLAAYDSNSVVQLTATPTTGYYFTGWSGDTTETANPISIRMNANKCVTANFIINSTPWAGMKLIPGGTFQMGNPDTSFTVEQPVHSVTVSSFYLDTTEVTQEDYDSLMGVSPSHFNGDSLRPVEDVTWFDAVLYCNARSKRDGKDTIYTFTAVSGTAGAGCSGLTELAITYSATGYRLPTEAEWEYACRAGTTTDYYWGGSYPPTTTADTTAIDNNVVWWHNSNDSTARVGTKLPNAYGLYDMSGNVWEWCNDWDGSYSSGSQTDPTGPSSGTLRVIRGGSWLNVDDNLRSALRGCINPDYWYISLGFRCVMR